MKVEAVAVDDDASAEKKTSNIDATGVKRGAVVILFVLPVNRRGWAVVVLQQ